MKLYYLFLLVTTLAILSPGPGVIMTLSNTLRYGLRKQTFGGILGISLGAFATATISVTGLNLLLATSFFTFSMLKFIGFIYLCYLGIKLWQSPPHQLDYSKNCDTNFKKLFISGFLLQITNPKTIFFFIAIFPQFINKHTNYFEQACILVATYSLLVILVHSVYATFANKIKNIFKLNNKNIFNKLTGAIFILFGVALILSKK